MDFSDRATTYNGESPWITNYRFISPLVPPPFSRNKFLDVCTGTGLVASYAKDIGWDVTATDINAVILEKARDDISKKIMSVEKMSFDSDSFEIVSCRQGLQYTDIEKAVSECIRVSSSQVRLLHGFVNESDIPVWQEIIHLLNRQSRKFFSDVMLNDIINSQCVSKKHIFEYDISDEIFDFSNSPHKEKILQLINLSPTFLENHSAYFDGFVLHYKLKWILNIIYKHEVKI